jgi:hypothetical protein
VCTRIIPFKRAIYVSHVSSAQQNLEPQAKIRSQRGPFAKGPLGAPLAEMREAVVPKLRHQPDLFTLAATRGYTHSHNTSSLPIAHTYKMSVFMYARGTYPSGSLNFGDE